jgi:hypothetical protein
VHEASLKPPAKQVNFLKRHFAAKDAEREKSKKEQEKIRQEMVFTSLASKFQEAISICPIRTRRWLDDNMHLLEEAEAKLEEAEPELREAEGGRKGSRRLRRLLRTDLGATAGLLLVEGALLPRDGRPPTGRALSAKSPGR